MKDRRSTRKKSFGGMLLFALQNYFIFFLLAAFITTCCMTLFITVLTNTLGIELTREDLNSAAKLTFLNVLLLSFIFTAIDALRRKFTIENNIRRIVRAADKVIKGDFSVRIPHGSRFARDPHFDEIIDCFNKMVEELSGVEMLRADFVSTVSHEMKTPITVIKNYATMLSAGRIDEETRKEYAAAIVGATNRLSEMMTNILRLNRLENQTIYPEGEVYDLSEQLCSALLEYESVWEDRNIEISTDIQDGVRICADAELLSLVWSNLLSNAFKFTDNGGRVSLTLIEKDGYAYVTVADTGCGIARDVGEHIFEKFYQADTSRSTQGNGLGLALVRRIIDILEADIRVESEVGVGTSFTVKLRSEQNADI